MGERSGVGLVETAILTALDSLGAGPDRRHRRSSRVLAALEQAIGLAPGYSYEVLVDMASPWIMPIVLVSGQGNFGSRGSDPAASPQYTECRLSPAGQVALRADQGTLAPVPIGIINGNTHRGGTRPPFRPIAVIEAVRQVVGRPRISNAEIASIVGPPYFVTNCTVHGDLAALNAGKPTNLQLRGIVSIDDDGRVAIEDLPPYANPDETTVAIAERAHRHDWEHDYPSLHREVRLPLRDVRDESFRNTGMRIVCTPEAGADPELVRDLIIDIYGVAITVPAALPKPLPRMIRDWTHIHKDEDLLASLDALEHALSDARSYQDYW
jgi:DNA gyrase subunit A